MFSSFSRPGLSELPARADFKAIDLVDEQPEPPVMRWRNPQTAEIAILAPAPPPAPEKRGLYLPETASRLSRVASRL